ncbi:hypothetical protein BJ165DRAFT_572228 [Panaeolus papilionaceus]|nr:hypothetical protein BJ165DRAFT_572228 [Panaeolus papilionaceus]
MVVLQDMPYDMAMTLQGVSWATTSIMVIQILDWLYFLPDEVECMWSWGKFNRVKLHYFLSRYVLLVLHITHYALSMQIFTGSPTLKFCIAVYVYRCAMIITAAALVETGLLLRVMALYHDKRFIIYLLFGFHIICLLLQITGQSKVISQLLKATTQCNPAPAQRVDLILVGLGVAISQSSFFGMTLYKLISENLWRKSCLAGMMLKEGICMFLAILIMIVSVALYENFRVTGTGIDLSELIFACFILSLSLVAPRLTLHLRKIAMKEPAYRTPISREHPLEQTKNITTLNSVCFTSYID